MKKYEVKQTNVAIGGKDNPPGVISFCAGTLYEPVGTQPSPVALVYNQAPNGVGEELAGRGYRCLEIKHAGLSLPNSDLSFKETSESVDFLKEQPGVKYVIGVSWSGGNAGMTAFQAIAENGCQVFQNDNMLCKVSDLPALTPCDGIICLDPNWGSVMQLMSLDPSVRTEGNAMDLDPTLDLFNPDNGFQEGGCTYSEDFIRRFQAGQAVRMNRLIQYCEERVALIDQGKGLFEDDEPLCIVSGVNQRDNNLLYPQDVRLLSRTKEEWPLIHADGSITKEIIHSVRRPMNFKGFTRSFALGAKQTSVKDFLKRDSVRVSDDYGFDADSMYGVDFTSSYGCTIGSAKQIHVPILICSMTASWEFVLADNIYYNAQNADKTIVFIEGAGHNFNPETSMEAFPGQFGDTRGNLFDYIAGWINDGSRLDA